MDLDCLLKTFRSRRLGYGHGHNAKSAIPILGTIEENCRFTQSITPA